MNPHLETLKDEMREECGDTICQADWDCFWDGLGWINGGAKMFSECYSDIEAAAKKLAAHAQGTRADLPSIVKYAYAAIEENLK